MRIWFVALIPFSPALLAIVALFPFYWIGQYRLLRQTGSWIAYRESHARWMRFLAQTVLVSYVLVLGSLAFPGVFPTLRRLLAEGWLYWGIVIPLLVDLGILMSFSHDKAAELWKAEETANQT